MNLTRWWVNSIPALLGQYTTGDNNRLECWYCGEELLEDDQMTLEIDAALEVVHEGCWEVMTKAKDEAA